MLKKLFQPIDIAILVYFRILCASLISFELINSLAIGDIVNYAQSGFHFSYQLVPWLNPWPENWMYAHYAATIICGFLVAAGVWYRYTTVLFFLGFTSLFLMEETDYVNHTYLYCLITFWMIIMPLNRAASYDAYVKPSIKSSYGPAWCYYLLLFQISVVYFYAGVAKLNIDWLHGRPMHMVMPYQGDTFLIGKLLVLPFAHYFISYAGLIFDLFIVPAMLFKRTRIYGFIFALVFHLSNVLIFGLATFPWFSIMMTSLFFGTSWPRKIPIFSKILPHKDEGIPYLYPNLTVRYSIVCLILFYSTVQVLLPLRHWLYPGNVNWTEEAHYFSWRMMLRAKSGTINYHIHFPGSDTTIVENPRDYIVYSQYKDLLGKPELIIQFAHFLSKKYKEETGLEPIITAHTDVSLNGRPYQPIVDPEVNLATRQRHLKPYDWIVPLKE